jgi:hypothetical protein
MARIFAVSGLVFEWYLTLGMKDIEGKILDNAEGQLSASQKSPQSKPI